MSGSAPYAVRSPTLSNPYPPPYSPTHPNRPYYTHDYQQIPPPPPHVMQTPPPFAPASLVHSPHLGRSLASPVPASNNSIAPPPPPSSSTSYQQVNSSPPYSLPRTYSGHLVQTGMMPPYDGTPSSHAHPPSRQGSVIQSPVREHYRLQNGTPREQPQSDSRPQSKEVRNTSRNPLTCPTNLLFPETGSY